MTTSFTQIKRILFNDAKIYTSLVCSCLHKSITMNFSKPGIRKRLNKITHNTSKALFSNSIIKTPFFSNVSRMQHYTTELYDMSNPLDLPISGGQLNTSITDMIDIINNLPPKQQHIIKMYIGGYSIYDISKELNYSTKEIKQLMKDTKITVNESIKLRES